MKQIIAFLVVIILFVSCEQTTDSSTKPSCSYTDAQHKEWEEKLARSVAESKLLQTIGDQMPYANNILNVSPNSKSSAQAHNRYGKSRPTSRYSSQAEYLVDEQKFIQMSVMSADREQDIPGIDQSDTSQLSPENKQPYIIVVPPNVDPNPRSAKEERIRKLESQLRMLELNYTLYKMSESYRN